MDVWLTQRRKSMQHDEAIFAMRCVFGQALLPCRNPHSHFLSSKLHGRPSKSRCCCWQECGECRALWRHSPLLQSRHQQNWLWVLMCASCHYKSTKLITELFWSNILHNSGAQIVALNISLIIISLFLKQWRVKLWCKPSLRHRKGCNSSWNSLDVTKQIWMIVRSVLPPASITHSHFYELTLNTLNSWNYP